MDHKQELFEQRYRRVLQRHRQLSRGYVTRLGGNGVITHEPARRIDKGFSLYLLTIPLLVGFFVKAGIYLVLGDERYAAQLALLQEGGAVERAGAWVMALDPITELVAGMLALFFG